MARPLEFAIKVRDRFSATLSKLEKRVDGIKMRLNKALTSRLGMTAVITTITAGYGAIIKSSMAFEAALADVSTLVDTNTVSMKAFEEQIINMAPQVQKSTTEMANGLYQVVSAGIDTASSMDVLRVSAKAAVAGITDTFTSVDIITTGLNAYGKAASEAEQVSDVLFQTVKLGKTTFGELANFLGPVLPLANALHISFEEVGAAMSTMTASGIRTDVAATALRATFSSLIQNASKFRAIGIDVIKVAGEEGLTGVMDRLKEATGGDIEKIQKLIPNVRALAAVLTITGAGADKFTADLIAMKNASGSMSEAFDKQAETTKAAWNEMKAQFSSFAASVGKGLLPVVKTVLKFGSWLMKFIRVAFSNVGIILGEFSTHLMIIPKSFKAAWIAAIKITLMLNKTLWKTLVEMAKVGAKGIWDIITGKTQLQLVMLDLSRAMGKGMLAATTGMKDILKEEFKDVSLEFGVILDNLAEDLDLSLVEEQGKKIGKKLAEGVTGAVEEGVIPAAEKILEVSSLVETKLAEWVMNVQPIGMQVGDILTSTFDMVADGIGNAVANAIIEGDNLGEALKQVMKDVTKNVIRQLISIGVQRLILAGVVKAMGIQQFASESAQGIAAVYVNSFKSAAAIPVIGWQIAPGVAAANTAAAVSGLTGAFGVGMGTALGLAGQAHAGLTNVPAEGTFLLNKNERVLSPEQNQDLTNFLAGGGGGDVHVDIAVLPNATNADAMLQMSREDWDDVVSEQIAPALKRASERGVI